MKVAIREANTEQVVYSIEVYVANLDTQAKQEEFFVQAWKAAVEDGAVNPNEKAKYTFEVAAA